MNKQLLVTGVVALVVALAVGLTLTPENGKDGRDGNVGAISSPMLPYDYFGIGELITQAKRFPANSATSSVLCAIDNPRSATSSIDYLQFQSESNGLGAQNVFWSTTTAGTIGTSTIALTGAIALGTGQTDFVWSGNSATSSIVTNPNGTGDANVLAGRNANMSSNYILRPNEALVLKVGTGTAGVFSNYVSGSCGYRLTPLE